MPNSLPRQPRILLGMAGRALAPRRATMGVRECTCEVAHVLHVVEAQLRLADVAERAHLDVRQRLEQHVGRHARRDVGDQVLDAHAARAEKGVPPARERAQLHHVVDLALVAHLLRERRRLGLQRVGRLRRFRRRR
eukprot:317948-Prymnesium_polylepis.1